MPSRSRTKEAKRRKREALERQREHLRWHPIHHKAQEALAWADHERR